jgi:TorA maturation chaperone TorD
MDSCGELAGMLDGRAETYRFFASVFFKELSEDAIDELAVATYPDDTGNKSLNQGYALLRRYFVFAGSDMRTELACEYARVFLAAGVYTEVRDIAVPYESVFTSEGQMIMQDSRDDVCARYRVDGFKVASTLHEPDDHLSIELEYLASMAERTLELLRSSNDGAALFESIQRQKEFIRLHLLNWLPALREAVLRYATLPFYIGMLLVLEGYLQEDLELLEDAGVSLTMRKTA